MRQFGHQDQVYQNSPVPVLLGDIRHKPRNLFAVENDLVADTRLNEPVGIDQVAVQLKA